MLTGRLRVRDWETGEKQGTAVEIDAEAIGHDLLWGTTSSEEKFGDPDRRVADGRPWAPGAASEDSWAAPGVDRRPRRRSGR